MVKKEFPLEHSHVLENTMVLIDTEDDTVSIRTGDITVYFTFQEMKKIYFTILELQEKEE